MAIVELGGISTVDSILFQSSRVTMLKDRVKTEREMIRDHIESTNEWFAVQEAKEELDRRQEKLRLALSQDGEYNEMLESLGYIKHDLKEAEGLLSDLIVGYSIETRELMIEEGDGEGRKLVLTGKLGKREGFQPSLFGGQSDTIEAPINKEGK